MLVLVAVVGATSAGDTVARAGDAGTAADGGPVGDAGTVTDVCTRSRIEFGRSHYVVVSGGVVRIDLLLPDDWDGDRLVDLTIDGTEYTARLDVQDGSNDSQVTVLFDTATVGSGRPNATFRTAKPGDSVVVRSETRLHKPIPAATYELDAEAPCFGAAATLSVGAPGPVALDAYSGNRSLLVDLTSAGAVREALAAGDLADRPNATASSGGGVRLVAGSTLVLELRTPGFAALVPEVRAADATAWFRTLFGEVLTVRVEEVETVLNTEEDPERYRLRDFSEWYAVADAADDTYYVVVDTGAPVDRTPAMKDYGESGVAYSVTAAVEAAGNATTHFEFAEPAATVRPSPSVGEVVLAAEPNATVSGTTNLPNGTPVVVRLASFATDPFPVERRATVGRDGRFEASFDLGSVERRREFDVVVVRHGGDTLARAPGRVGPAATVRFDDRRAYVQHVERTTVQRVGTTHGGFVVLRRGGSSGPVVGVSDHIPPGNHTDVRVRISPDLDGNVRLVAVAYRDADGDGSFDPEHDERYATGRPTDAARFVDRDGRASATATQTPPRSTTATTPADGSPIPGVGGFGVAVALLAAALLAMRVFGGVDG